MRQDIEKKLETVKLKIQGLTHDGQQAQSDYNNCQKRINDINGEMFKLNSQMEVLEELLKIEDEAE